MKNVFSLFLSFNLFFSRGKCFPPPPATRGGGKGGGPPHPPNPPRHSIKTYPLPILDAPGNIFWRSLPHPPAVSRTGTAREASTLQQKIAGYNSCRICYRQVTHHRNRARKIGKFPDSLPVPPPKPTSPFRRNRQVTRCRNFTFSARVPHVTPPHSPLTEG